MRRVRPLAVDRLTRDQADLYAEIIGGPRAAGPQYFALTDDQGVLQGPFNAFLLSPGIGRALQALGSAVRYETDLTPRMRELAILTVAAAWNSAFERSAHEAVGRAAGLTEAELEAVRDGSIPETTDDDERIVLELCRALCEGDVDDSLWIRASETLGVPRAFELTTLVGYYATLALQLRVFRVDD